MDTLQTSKWSAQVAITIVILIAAAHGTITICLVWLLGGFLAWALTGLDRPERLWRYVLLWYFAVLAHWAADMIYERGIWASAATTGQESEDDSTYPPLQINGEE